MPDASPWTAGGASWALVRVAASAVGSSGELSAVESPQAAQRCMGWPASTETYGDTGEWRGGRRGERCWSGFGWLCARPAASRHALPLILLAAAHHLSLISSHRVRPPARLHPCLVYAPGPATAWLRNRSPGTLPPAPPVLGSPQRPHLQPATLPPLHSRLSLLRLALRRRPWRQARRVPAGCLSRLRAAHRPASQIRASPRPAPPSAPPPIRSRLPRRRAHSPAPAPFLSPLQSRPRKARRRSRPAAGPPVPGRSGREHGEGQMEPEGGRANTGRLERHGEGRWAVR